VATPRQKPAVTPGQKITEPLLEAIPGPKRETPAPSAEQAARLAPQAPPPAIPGNSTTRTFELFGLESENAELEQQQFEDLTKADALNERLTLLRQRWSEKQLERADLLRRLLSEQTARDGSDEAQTAIWMRAHQDLSTQLENAEREYRLEQERVRYLQNLGYISDDLIQATERLNLRQSERDQLRQRLEEAEIALQSIGHSRDRQAQFELEPQRSDQLRELDENRAALSREIQALEQQLTETQSRIETRRHQVETLEQKIQEQSKAP
jgi:chromosome segregation ATPase